MVLHPPNLSKGQATLVCHQGFAMGFAKQRRALLPACLLLSVSVVCGGQSAPDTQAGAASQHAVLVELFTSEGCSDCPPADLVLQKINGRTTAEGTPIVTLSEHVTYWNHQGWTDPFSDEAYTQRQAAYTQRLSIPDAFTPMVVVMGKTVVNGADGYKILQAVDADRNQTLVLHISGANVESDKLHVAFAAFGTLPRKGADIIAFVTDDTDTSAVKRGENQNRTLTHVSVARRMTRIATVKVSGAQNGTIDMPQSKGPHHLVLVAQEPGTGNVLAVETAAIAEQVATR